MVAKRVFGGASKWNLKRNRVMRSMHPYQSILPFLVSGKASVSQKMLYFLHIRIKDADILNPPQILYLN